MNYLLLVLLLCQILSNYKNIDLQKLWKPTFIFNPAIEKIFNIKITIGLGVRIEPLKKTTGIIPQCKCYQAFKHIQKYYNQQFRCIKCACSHITKECTVDPNTPDICVNCKGN